MDVLFEKTKQLQCTAHRAASGLLRDHALCRRLTRAAEDMETSNGTRYYEPFPYRVGIVADEFIVENYRDTCDLLYLTPTVGEEILRGLSLLLVVSTWHGLANEWTRCAVEGDPVNRRLHEIMQLCRGFGVPVAFYSKEDPANYEHFKNLAADADFIFTSALESIPDYQVLYPGKPVELMPFAVNPLLNNPIGMNTGDGPPTAVFAGSWMPKYPKRLREQRDIFQWLLEEGVALRIIDRNDRRNLRQFRYPLSLQKYVLPPVSYGRLAAWYKLHTWVVNLNSSYTSETMFAMRVYDAMACGAPILSNESVGMERQFPEIFVPHSREDLRRALECDPAELRQRRLHALRRMMNGHTVYDRMAALLTACGLPAAVPERRVAVLIDPAARDTAALTAQFERQTRPNACLITGPAELARAEGCDMLAIWTDGRIYEPDALTDLADGFKYTAGRYITRPSRAGTEREHCYTDRIADKYDTLFWRADFPPEELYRMAERISAPGGYRITTAD